MFQSNGVQTKCMVGYESLRGDGQMCIQLSPIGMLSWNVQTILVVKYSKIKFSFIVFKYLGF